MPHLYTLLPVEDHAALLNDLSDFFAKHFRVITAKNGATGIEKAKLYFQDLIISDVMMAEMDGLEMCRKLTSIIMLSLNHCIFLYPKLADKK